MESHKKELQNNKNYQALLDGWKKHLEDMELICALLQGRKGLVGHFISQFEDHTIEKYGEIWYSKESIDIMRKDLENVVIEVYGPDL
tara:strand:+ start:11603 stop:11863 length:261 start_codon:yes stop_codon:yes gene_type:complete